MKIKLILPPGCNSEPIIETESMSEAIEIVKAFFSHNNNGYTDVYSPQGKVLTLQQANHFTIKCLITKLTDLVNSTIEPITIVFNFHRRYIFKTSKFSRSI